MSYFTYIDSACGRTAGRVEIKDRHLSPHGIICCGECRTIIQSREAWLSDPYVRMYA
jgi:hypothetical protein